jgi:uncharacterized DUF497 family protein
LRYTWDETRRLANRKKHGLAFADAEKVLAGSLLRIDDYRVDYGEQRMIGIGLLDCLVVLIVPVESDEAIRIISMRKADSNETDLFYQKPDTSDDAPKLTPADFERARPRIAGREVSRAEWQAAVRQRVGKLRINIMRDAPIVEHFKALAGERGYQTIINDTLRRVIESGHLEADLRQVIREELARR